MRNDSTCDPTTARLWLVSMTVWVDSWQLQCCGEPFRRGSKVTWTLRDVDPDWFETMLGPRARRTVEAAEEHHGGVPEDTLPTRGTVTLIAAVHCHYAPRPGSDSRTSHPVPGSGVLTEVESADGWTADRGEERFVGYLVQLKP
jgi:Family of unknown function (DUF6578)